MFSKIKEIWNKKRNKRQMEKKGLIGVRKRKTQEDTLGNVAENSKMLFTTILIALWIICIVAISFAPKNEKIAKQLSVEGNRSPLTVTAEHKFTVDDFDAQERLLNDKLHLVPIHYSISKSLNKDIIDSAMVVFDIYDNSISKKDLKELQVFNREKVDSEKKELSSTAKVLETSSKTISPTAKKVFETTLRENQFKNKNKNKFLNPAKLTTEQILFLKKIDQKFPIKENYLKVLEEELENGVISRREKSSYSAGQKVRIIDTHKRLRKVVDVGLLLDNVTLADKIADKIAVKYEGFQAIELKIIVKKITDYVMSNHNNSNLVINDKINAKEKEIVLKDIKKVEKTYFRGDVIVKQNQLLTANLIKVLHEYDKVVAKNQVANHFKVLVDNTKIALITLFLILVTGLYLWHIHPEIVKSNQKLCLCSSVILVSIIVNYLAMYVFYTLYEQFNIAPFLINQLILIALPAVLLSVLIGLRVAFYVGLFCSIIASMMLDNSYSVLLEGLMITAIAGFAVRYANNYRTYFIRCILAVTFSLLLLNHSFLLSQFDSPQMLLWSFSLSLANGFITATLALVLIFTLELIFGVSSDMGMLTLCDYNHPLLQRLQIEAPGTFHHSLMVATLAEQAAIAIGASSIKVRVGALFHDIGKLHKPEYFTENNSEHNKHSELRPRMSSLIIINHIKDGVDLAIKYKMRKFIIDTIEQHHGNDLVMYFYNRAKEENSNLSVDKNDYRYPGPLPQSKEIVIIMLADACEAASRSLQKPTHAKIESLVWEIFRRRLRDGQLNDAPITFSELSKIRDSFVLTLTTMLHSRIAYPKDEEIENEDDLFVEQRKISSSE
ncbi:HDIG domain-containing metalloprotein [Lentisphaerota bacterium WC36G]|nr:HDIG domain-containing protein [Lentisphaerae bacterium WC36]